MYTYQVFYQPNGGNNLPRLLYSSLLIFPVPRWLNLEDSTLKESMIYVTKYVYTYVWGLYIYIYNEVNQSWVTFIQLCNNC